MYKTYKSTFFDPAIFLLQDAEQQNLRDTFCNVLRTLLVYQSVVAQNSTQLKSGKTHHIICN